ncbi:MAG: response regulator [Deltaproteobacteria bacterium]|nr:response regulator [Deltaproteobacteria bacterium]
MKKMKVLLVDDEVEFVNSLADRLGMRGISTDVVYDGQQALDYVAKHAPDVIVLDLEMPKVHGMELLRQLSETHPNIQVVILTAFGTKEREEEAENLQAFDFLNKLVDIETLAERIRGAYRYKMENIMAAVAFAEAGEFDMANEISKGAKRFKTIGEIFRKEK